MINRIYQRFKWLLIVCAINSILVSCSRKYIVNYEGVKFENVFLKTNSTKDSIFLSLTVTYAPKSFGEKAVMVIRPVITYNNDTLKFKTITHGGCGFDDCDCIGYKALTERKYNNLPSHSTEHLPVTDYMSGNFMILVYSAKSKLKQPFIAYQKKLFPSEFKIESAPKSQKF